jgi:hypothetical protein
MRRENINVSREGEKGRLEMAQNRSLGARWSDYRPTKGLWLWSCVGCIVGTMIVGFGFGGWVTQGSASAMSKQAADQARIQLAAGYCVSRFDAQPDLSTKLAALKSTDSWQRGDYIDKGGWAKLPWIKDEIDGVASLCAQKLISAAASPTKPSASSG